MSRPCRLRTPGLAAATPLGLLLLLAAAPPASAAVRTVCPPGSPQGPCDFPSPGACAIGDAEGDGVGDGSGIDNGDTCLVKGGVYRETVTFQTTPSIVQRTKLIFQCDPALSCRIEGDRVRENGFYGYTGWQIRGFEVTGTKGDAITSHSSRYLTEVSGCWVHDVGGKGIANVSVDATAANNRISGNRIERTADAGINCAAVPPAQVVNNLVVDAAWATGYPISCAAGRVEHNTVDAGALTASLYGLQGKETRYNLVRGARTSLRAESLSAYNRVFGWETASYGYGTGVVPEEDATGDLRFLASGDYHLDPSSAAVDAALSSTEPFDLAGLARIGVPDQGAYELDLAHFAQVDPWQRREQVVLPTAGGSPAVAWTLDGPVAAWLDPTAKTVRFARRQADGVWRVETVQTNVDTAWVNFVPPAYRGLDLALEPRSGKPVLAWVEHTAAGRRLRYAVREGWGCGQGCASTQWSGCSDAPVLTLGVGERSSLRLAFDPGTREPVIALFRETTNGCGLNVYGTSVLFLSRSGGAWQQTVALSSACNADWLGPAVGLSQDPVSGRWEIAAAVRTTVTITSNGALWLATGDGTHPFVTSVLPIGAGNVIYLGGKAQVDLAHAPDGRLGVAYTARLADATLGAYLLERTGGVWSGRPTQIAPAMGNATTRGLRLDYTADSEPVVVVGQDDVVQLVRQQGGEWTLRGIDLQRGGHDWLDAALNAQEELLVLTQRATPDRAILLRSSLADPGGIDPETVDPDACDGCPGDPAKTDPGVCGCGVPDTDRDGDGAADCVDGCPDDPAKHAPGQCGCGKPEADRDGDGTPDCADGCPDDLAKIQPLLCGCGVAEDDRDGDGTVDCLDGCPDDGAKVEGGVCGCGRPDDDLDADGLLGCEEVELGTDPADPDSDDDGLDDGTEVLDLATDPRDDDSDDDGRDDGTEVDQGSDPRVAALPFSPLLLSADITVVADGVTLDDGQVARWAAGEAPAPVPPADLPPDVDLVAFHQDVERRALLVTDVTVELTGGVVAGPRDVVQHTDAGYALFATAAALGLPDGVAIDALTLRDGKLLLSLDGSLRLGELDVDDEDLWSWDPATGVALVFDGSAAGVPPELDLAAAHWAADDEVLLLAFDGAGAVGEVRFTAQDVLQYTAAGPEQAATWEKLAPVPGLAAAWGGARLDALSLVPVEADADDDGLPDWEELALGTDPHARDTDHDSLSDGEEVLRYGTDPLDEDTDDDGLDDRSELDLGTDPLEADGDDDGLIDPDELLRGTDPFDGDSDDDGLTDGEEVHVHDTDPVRPDSDGDGLGDGAEVHDHGTDPRLADTDGDGTGDGLELDAGRNPNVALVPVRQLTVSPDVDLAVGALTLADEELLELAAGADPARQAVGLPTEADLAAYHRLAGGEELVVPDTTVALPGGLTVTPRDVARRELDGTWTLALDGGAAGLPDGAAIDALTVTGAGKLALSLDVTAILGELTVGPADLVVRETEPPGWSALWRGAAAGVPAGANLDAAHLLGDGLLLLSFDVAAAFGPVRAEAGEVLEHTLATGSWEKLPLPAGVPVPAGANLDAVWVGGLPVIELFAATPPTIRLGETAELAWRVRGADSVTLEPGFAHVAAESTVQVGPRATTTYRLTATNDVGEVSATLALTVVNDPPVLLASAELNVAGDLVDELLVTFTDVGDPGPHWPGGAAGTAVRWTPDGPFLADGLTLVEPQAGAEGELRARHLFPEPGRYPVTVRVCDQASCTTRDLTVVVFCGSAGLNQPCATGVGACRAAGRTLCLLETRTVGCDASPGAPLDLVDGTCDGVDDDCDGQEDEEYQPVECGLGACLARSSCLLGVEQACTPGETGGGESCNGLDDDCDGTVDDGLEPDDCISACVLAGGQPVDFPVEQCCGDDPLEGRPYEAAESSCEDVRDNDCDGLLDCADPDCADACAVEVDGGGVVEDAGVDAGTPDAGERDAGAPDLGAPDLGPPDAGPSPDAGGLADTGPADGGSPPDQGHPPADLGPSPDTGDLPDLAEEPDLPGLPDGGSPPTDQGPPPADQGRPPADLSPADAGGPAPVPEDEDEDGGGGICQLLPGAGPRPPAELLLLGLALALGRWRAWRWRRGGTDPGVEVSVD
ncbi:MAG: right-handed parallel beta-helix repeat-containing protein [Myxococcota bacterium]|nr:right-handed parallel beta-helix repeat-containing protein [Myxococcota bacterium]